MFLALLVPEPGGAQAVLRDRVADAVAIVVALFYGTVMMVLGDAMRPGPAIPWQADLALGVACAGALLVRRRFPLAVAGVLLPFGAISVTATGPIIVALFTAAIRHRLPLVLLLGAGNIATSGVYFLLHDHPAYGIWLDLLIRGLVTGAAVGWGLFVQAYRRLTTSLRDHAARLVAEQQWREEQARSTERARIAREMHDVLAHRMSLISLHAGALEVRVDASVEERAIAAGAIRRSAHDALEELRTVVGVPDGRPEPPQPGLGDMTDLITSARAAGMTVDYWNGVSHDSPPSQLSRTAYRIIQECLTNARKHGTGPAAAVRLFGAAGRGLRIVVTNPLHGTANKGTGHGTAHGDTGHGAAPVDTGHGASPADTGHGASTADTGHGASTPDTGRWTAHGGTGSDQRRGHGLIGIDERVALAGGRVTHGPSDDEFRTEVDLPWPK
ncbi:sensor histidine kinase [Actinoplanes couchii]|uniref:histidine kinase n=1 Tax=Actinoplanes couchii TaxID=403638 RepID=A0ABQ3X169_9ACTN|nr:histidine kinase [Actinoplanes couchii]MDR6316528.1 signal transduction histidine kinase [Actinoplanes couchii]GID52143.1 two-component sensor histidine kinase [Actinoplanes couchii]